MSRSLIALAFLALTSTAAFAQDDRPSVVVYPFGLASAARTTSSDVAGLFAARALEGVIATQRLAAINESANPAIKSQLEGAMTLPQFASAVQIKTDRQLQSKYMLTGFVQTIETKQAKGRNNATIYQTTVTATIQLYDVETREVVSSDEIQVYNGVLGAVALPKECKGIRRLACIAAAQTASKKLSGATGGSAGEAINDETPEAALESALRTAPAKISAFLIEAIK